jgi:hypothetical protein
VGFGVAVHADETHRGIQQELTYRWRHAQAARKMGTTTV